MRLHDQIYLKSNRYKKPKEKSKMLLKILKKKLSKNKKYTLLDIGCANGELIYFLSKNLKNIDYFGVDIRNDLLNLAKKKNLSQANFRRVDFNKRNNFNQKFDIIIASGVISIFDNLNIFFQNLKKCLKTNSKIFLGGHFNNFDYDVRVKYTDLKIKKKIYQSGWNIWSIKTIKNHLKSKKMRKHNFFIKYDVKITKNDQIRSWTIKINKKRYFTNALKIIQNQMWLEFN